MLETSYNMGGTIFQMKKNLKVALDKIKNDPTTSGWFSKYILYPFDSSTSFLCNLRLLQVLLSGFVVASNKNYWYPPVISSNSDDIVAAVNNITAMACPGPDGCSPGRILETISLGSVQRNFSMSSEMVAERSSTVLSVAPDTTTLAF